jgi:hypothetical protein
VSAAWSEAATTLVTAYTGAGILFGILFVVRGVQRIDASAVGAGWGFRLLILPGVAALWPLLAWRWLRGDGAQPIESNAHRRNAG